MITIFLQYISDSDIIFNSKLLKYLVFYNRNTPVKLDFL